MRPELHDRRHAVAIHGGRREPLADGEAAIIAELHAGRGAAADQGGYYRADAAKTAAIMRPSATLNAIIG